MTAPKKRTETKAKRLRKLQRKVARVRKALVSAGGTLGTAVVVFVPHLHHTERIAVAAVTAVLGVVVTALGVYFAVNEFRGISMSLKLTGAAALIPAIVLGVLAVLGNVPPLTPIVPILTGMVIVLLGELGLNPKVQVSATVGTIVSGVLALLAALIGSFPELAPILSAATTFVTTVAGYLVPAGTPVAASARKKTAHRTQHRA